MFTSGLVFWHWFVLAMILLVMELFAPAAFLIWIGAAAAMLGVIVLLLPGLSWQLQCILFAVLAIAAVIIGRKLFRRHSNAEPTTLNRRGSEYVGREFSLLEPITNGRGQLKIDDTLWRIDGPDLPAGSRVRVESMNGATLVVTASR